MKKCISKLFILMIIFMIIPISTYAKIKASEKNTAEEILKYYQENNKKISNISDDILVAWYGTLYNNTPSSSFDTWNAKYGDVYKAIGKELNNRKIDTSLDSEINSANINGWKPTIRNNSQLIKMGGQILGIVQVVGSIVSVFALVLLGIKYMLASVDEKASYKETMIPYIIGAIILFGIVNISKALYVFASKLN